MRLVPRLGLRAVAMATAALAAPSAAGAQAVQDATCPPFSGSNFVTAGTQRYAQTFTALATGKLTSARVRVTKNMSDPAGDYQLHIVRVSAGVPTNDWLGTAVVPDDSVPGGSINLPITGAFPAPPDVTAGVEYALVVTRPPAGANGLRLEGRGDACPGGLFLSPSQTDPFVEQVTYDLVFTVFVDGRAPQVAIGKRPKKRTKSRKARFKFTSDEPGSSFECKLDRGAFKPCASPVKVKKLKRRGHRFQVRAIDAAGNVGLAATVKWRIRRP